MRRKIGVVLSPIILALALVVLGCSNSPTAPAPDPHKGFNVSSLELCFCGSVAEVTVGWVAADAIYPNTYVRLIGDQGPAGNTFPCSVATVDGECSGKITVPSNSSYYDTELNTGVVNLRGPRRAAPYPTCPTCSP